MNPPPKTWNPWPVAIIAFFVVAITGCVGFVIFCSRHPAELVAADYYEQEVRFQGQIERVQRTQQLGAQPAVKYDAARKAITVTLPSGPAEARPTGEILLYRPSAAGLDRRVALEPDAAGRQLIDARDLADGLWKVKVRWTAAGQEYFLDQSVVVVAPKRERSS